MTGTTSSRGMSAFDSDSHRNQEWLRRRKLRLEQVRKQSNEIAKALRQKVMDEEKARLDEYDRMGEAKFRDWKACKLEELERKFKSALEDFGKSYKLAEVEPDPEEVLEERLKVNLAKAQQRGEIAKQEELKRKKMEEEQKTSLIERKKLIRKKEDLRSALIHSMPNKKQIFEKKPIIETQKILEEKVQPEKVPIINPVKKKFPILKEQGVPSFQKKESVNKVKKKKVTSQKSCMCKHKPKSSEFHPMKEPERIWINLNDIQNSSTGDLTMHPLSLKSSYSNERIERERPEGMVEFYDFSSRCYRKSFREFPHVVQRIDPESEWPNANDLARMEVEEEKVEARKKLEADTVSQERGMEALRRQRIYQEYNNLIAKLEELNKREKILKAQQRNNPTFFHMNDERLSEKLKAKQRLMDSKFEDIYQDVISQIPRAEPPRPKPFCRKGGGDFAEDDETALTGLSFSPGRLKTNTPVTSDGEAPQATPPKQKVRKPRKTKRKRQLLQNIDKALKEGRELRKAISRTRDSPTTDGGEEKSTPEPEEEQPRPPAEILPGKDEVKRTKCQESQTEDVKSSEVGVGVVDLRDFGQTGDDSLPVSTSTSYKSPPSVIRSYRLRQFLEYLEGITEAEDTGYSKKIDRLLYDLLNNSGKKSGKKEVMPCRSPTLEYYIKKLLNMSRECVADLSVSSENISTPNITDLDVRGPETAHSSKISSEGEEIIRKSRLERAEQLEETIKNWKRILEKNSVGPSELEDVLDCPRPELGTRENEHEEPVRVIYSPKISSRYEEITKKCSERISELSDMLDKLRKDKEKLLGSTSGGSSLSLNKEGGNSDKESDVNEEEKPSEGRLGSLEDLRSSLVEGFLNRYNISKPRKETESTAAVADSQSQDDLEESLESLPDVMDELLKRKILTSPFKWSDGEYSSDLSDVHTKPSSIETVIGNFRREISKIKPFSLSDSFPRSGSFLNSFDERHEDELKHAKKGVSPRWPAADPRQAFQEESSVESINQALTTLGLNWAKSFLRKNEESRAISSSSNSEGKCSGDEADGFP